MALEAGEISQDDYVLLIPRRLGVPAQFTGDELRVFGGTRGRRWESAQRLWV